jgi:Restriction endonuclease
MGTFLDGNSDRHDKLVIDILKNHGAPMHIDAIVARLKMPAGKPKPSKNSLTSTLSKVTGRPREFTLLKQLGGGCYTLAAAVSVVSVPPLSDADFFNMPEIDFRYPFGRPLDVLSVDEQDERAAAILFTMRAFLSELNGTDLLTTKRSLPWLVNLAFQEGWLDKLRTAHNKQNAEKMTIEEIVPYLRRALHDREQIHISLSNISGHPLYVWLDNETVVFFDHAAEQAQIQFLLAQDGMTFRATVRAVLDGLGARQVHEIKGRKTVTFRAELDGRSVAVRAVNACNPVEQEDVQQLRGAMDTGEEGLLLSLATATDEARMESQRTGVAPVRLIAMQEFLPLTRAAAATLARHAETPTNS